jgi:hypothetical protein
MTTLIGGGLNELPAGGALGRMAAQDPKAVVLEPQPNVTPHAPGDMVFQLTSNTSLVIKVRGSDGTVRSTTLTLA